VARLKDQDPEHQHVVIGWSTAQGAIRARHGPLEVWTEGFEVHQRVYPLEVVALRRNLTQPLLDVEQSACRAMIHLAECPRPVNHYLAKGTRVFGGVQL
jgi:hypothetical protein